MPLKFNDTFGAWIRFLALSLLQSSQLFFLLLVTKWLLARHGKMWGALLHLARLWHSWPEQNIRTSTSVISSKRISTIWKSFTMIDFVLQYVYFTSLAPWHHQLADWQDILSCLRFVHTLREIYKTSVKSIIFAGDNTLWRNSSIRPLLTYVSLWG